MKKAPNGTFAKSHMYTIRVSPAEAEAIRATAEAAGQSINTWARRALAEKVKEGQKTP